MAAHSCVCNVVPYTLSEAVADHRKGGGGGENSYRETKNVACMCVNVAHFTTYIYPDPTPDPLSTPATYALLMYTSCLL